MGYFAGLGLGATVLPETLWARAAAGEEITAATIAAAEELAGLRFADDQRAMMLDGLRQQARRIAALHAVPLDHAVAPAIVFDPTPPATSGVNDAGNDGAMTGDRRFAVGGGPPAAGADGAVTPRRNVNAGGAPRRPLPRANPANLDELAFLPAADLSELVRRRRVTSEQLTRMYLARLERFDPTLRCVVTLTADRALRHARAMDQELARGRWRGPLHGIPWGAKDLLATRGYPTTWGAGPFRDQVIDADATVVTRLDEAGAVLVAKLSLGELAQGDVWFGHGATDARPDEKRTGQRTRNPWKPDQGSSGSSAGPASATAAGLVAFSIGSETLGSISSPSTRCGTTGLRPTFGRVPRTGAMALSWTMDKLGPICRSAEDCALVLEAIHGADGRDLTARTLPFAWDPSLDVRRLRVGYVKSAFDLPEKDPADSTRTTHATRRFDDAALDSLRALGVRLVPVELPDLPYDAMRIILVAEAAAAFDALTRSGRDRELVQQGPNDWANSFRTARFIPAADYINANRLRSVAIARWAELMRTVDVIITPTSAAGLSQLVATNLTGHPAVILPSGFRDDGTPVSITFLGRLYGEASLLAVAHAWQRATGFHLRRPPISG